MLRLAVHKSIKIILIYRHLYESIILYSLCRSDDGDALLI